MAQIVLLFENTFTSRRFDLSNMLVLWRCREMQRLLLWLWPLLSALWGHWMMIFTRSSKTKLTMLHSSRAPLRMTGLEPSLVFPGLPCSGWLWAIKISKDFLNYGNNSQLKMFGKSWSLLLVVWWWNCVVGTAIDRMKVEELAQGISLSSTMTSCFQGAWHYQVSWESACACWNSFSAHVLLTMPEHCPLDCSPAERETWQSLEKCTARQAFLKMLVTEWKGTLSGSGTSQHATRKAFFSKHGEADWAQWCVDQCPTFFCTGCTDWVHRLVWQLSWGRCHSSSLEDTAFTISWCVQFIHSAANKVCIHWDTQLGRIFDMFHFFRCWQSRRSDGLPFHIDDLLFISSDDCLCNIAWFFNCKHTFAIRPAFH